MRTTRQLGAGCPTILLFVVAAALSAPASPAESASTIHLSGSDWRIHEDLDGKGAERGMPQAGVSAPDWIPASVPGNIQADLEAAHRLRPLWYGGIDKNLYDVARKDWWYRKDFVVPASYAGKRLTLVFDGVDEGCRVWLNGKEIGSNAGMFRRFSFDVSAIAEAGKTNHLALSLRRMPEELVPYLVNSDGPDIPGQKYWFVNGIIRTRQLLKDLKSPTNFGWDWGVNIWTLGIWKDVRLEATGQARIAWTRVRTELSDNFRKATVRVNLEIDSQKDGNAQASFSITRLGKQEVQKTLDVTLKPGTNHVEVELPLEHPALWWCNGQGDQPLYTLRAAILPADGGAALDERTARFGVREVRWVHTQGVPKDFVSRYQLILNGRPVRTIGSCLIPPDLLFGRCGPKSMRLLDLARDAGMTMLRMWGGGVILPEEFYARADELGIMLSQEMPLANSWPETDAVFLANLETTVRNIIRQLRNHPSVIEFDGGNEMPWNSTTRHPALQLLQKIVAEEDGRLTRATCPDLGAAHSPWDFDVHGSYAHYNNTRPMRYGEFGAQTPANLEVWRRDIPSSSQWPIRGTSDPVLIRKNVVQACFSPEHWLLKRRIENLFGSIDNLPDMVRGGQFLGAEALRYACDSNRRAGAAMGGFTTWDFNEPWPNGAGSYMVDYDGRTLMNYDFIKQAIAPIALSLKYDSLFYDSKSGVKANLFVVSDAPGAAENLRWKWLARDRRGEVFAHDEGTASISPLEVKSLATLTLRPAAKTAFGPLFVELRLEDATGKLLAERLHVFGPAGVAGPLRGLLDNRRADEDDDSSRGAIPRPVRRAMLQVTPAPPRREGDQEVLELAVKNTGPMMALFCEPHPLIEYRTGLYVENNHCFIPPGENRTITIRAAARPAGELTLAQTGWWLSCWNADDVTIEPSADVLLAVGRRDAMCREFSGYDDAQRVQRAERATLTGRRPDPAPLPYLLDSARVARFEFPLDAAQAKRPARLRIHSADQAEKSPTVVAVTINGRRMEAALPTGLGIQRSDPAHLAFPATVEFHIPATDLRPGNNVIEVGVAGKGWFSWDALDLVTEFAAECNAALANGGHRLAPAQSPNLREATYWLEAKSQQLVRQSRSAMNDGTPAFIPQAGGGYRAFWLRDYAYMLEGCPEAFTHQELKSSLLTFVGALSTKGASVDHVNFDGTNDYGSLATNPVADGSMFTVDVAWRTYQQTRDVALLKQVIGKLLRTMNAVPLDPNGNGLVYIDPKLSWDRMAWGFTDTVRQSGDTLMCSLLYVRACGQLAELLTVVGEDSQAASWRTAAKKTTASIRSVLWNSAVGLFNAATVRCNQPDIMGSAFAVDIGVATPEQATTIANYFNSNYDAIVVAGQVRHLPGKTHWQNRMETIAPETYQNGGYWGVATGWFANTLARVNPAKARQMLVDVVNNYKTGGVYEWVTSAGAPAGVGNYCASATMPLILLKQLSPLPAQPVLVETGGSLDAATDLALAANGGVAFAKNVIAGNANHAIAHLNDGKYGNSHSWIGSANSTFCGVAFQQPSTISALAFGRDNLGTEFNGGPYNDRYAGMYVLQYTRAPHPDASTPDSAWTSFGALALDTSGAVWGDGSGTYRRHLYKFNSITDVTGVRLLLDTATLAIAIDELEVYRESPRISGKSHTPP
jgi:beta-mannosidase